MSKKSKKTDRDVRVLHQLETYVPCNTFMFGVES